MVRWWMLMLFLPLLVLLAFTACGQEVPVDQETPAAEETPNGSTGTPAGQSGTWPAYIPADIPPLHDSIRTVIEGSTHVRIFYHGLSQEQIDAYLELLKNNGFQLEYVVYKDERLPDEVAEKRLMEGDFDAVHITKGPYHLNMEYGEDEAFLDVNTSGWEDDYPLTPVREWPADLTDVPVPDRCGIEGVYPQDLGGYQIVCRPDDGEAVADYSEVLQAAGFAPTDPPRIARPPVGGDYPLVFALGDTEITLDYSASVSTVRITVWRVPPPETAAQAPQTAPAQLTAPSSTTATWPSELAGMLPQPEGVLIESVQEVGELDFMIVCRLEHDDVALDYVARLKTEGFTETSRMEAQSGRLVALMLANDRLTVDLLLSENGLLVIRIIRLPAGVSHDPAQP